MEEFKALQDDIQSNEEPSVARVMSSRPYAEETDDPHEVTYYLAKNREEFRRFASLTPDQAAREAIKLDTRLALQAAAPAPDKKPAEPKPKPPAPVGGRASATAFDVSDTSLSSADEWAKLRNEQLNARNEGGARWTFAGRSVANGKHNSQSHDHHS
jgi:hypothetical protein